jgi:hypothetical protein
MFVIKCVLLSALVCLCINNSQTVCMLSRWSLTIDYVNIKSFINIRPCANTNLNQISRTARQTRTLTIKYEAQTALFKDPVRTAQ